MKAKEWERGAGLTRGEPLQDRLDKMNEKYPKEKANIEAERCPPPLLPAPCRARSYLGPASPPRRRRLHDGVLGLFTKTLHPYIF